MKDWQEMSELDRLGEDRESAADAMWEGAFVLEVRRDGAFAAREGEPVALSRPGPRGDDDILLGVHGGRAWFARPVDELTSGEAQTWRDAVPGWYHPLAAAVALVRWHATAPLCEACGATTVPDSVGARRRCTRCDHLVFPRQDPAVIVAVLDPEGRLLLGRQASWAPGRVSILAGFVEAGESLEHACRREVWEEVGVRLDGLRYAGSQPWPMPRSLMTGFYASTSQLDLAPDMREIIEARWWTAQDLRDAVAAGTVTLPPVASIARSLIEGWFAGGVVRP